MSWNKLAPIQKTSGRPMASASIVMNKDGVPKISLILSSSLKDEFGEPEKADVHAGEGEHEGSLLVEFTKTGAFDVGGFVHGGARIFLPIPPGCPDKPAANEPCTIGDKIGAGPEVLADGMSPSVVIHLPVAAWRAAIQARVSPPVRTPAAPPPIAPAGTVKRLNVVDYLSGKGVKISRLADNRFAVDGETLMFGAVLKMVNDIRKAADLDPLTAAQVQ